MKRQTMMLLQKVQKREQSQQCLPKFKSLYSYHTIPSDIDPGYDPYEDLYANECDMDADIEGDTDDYEYHQCLYNQL